MNNLTRTYTKKRCKRAKEELNSQIQEDIQGVVKKENIAVPPQQEEQESSYTSDIENGSELDPEKFIEKFKFAPASDEDENQNEDNMGGMEPLHDQEFSGSSNDGSFNQFYDHQEDHCRTDEDMSGKVSQRSNQHLVPIEFAKAHILKIEEDMKKMHERHVKLMREMDENYKLIEQETQEYYIEFLQKWKEVAKSKITQYRKAIETLAIEKEQLIKQKDQEIDTLNDNYTQLYREKQKIMQEYNDNITMRDNEMDSLTKDYQEKSKIKDKEISSLKNKISEQAQDIQFYKQQLEEMKGKMQRRQEENDQEIEMLKKETEEQYNNLDIKFNLKVEQNSQLEKELSNLKSKIEKLEHQLTQQQNQSILSQGSQNTSAQPIKLNRVINVVRGGNQNMILNLKGRNTNDNQNTTSGDAPRQQSEQPSSQGRVIQMQKIKGKVVVVGRTANQLNNSVIQTSSQQPNMTPSKVNYQSMPPIDSKKKEEAQKIQEEINQIDQERRQLAIKLKKYQEEQMQKLGEAKGKKIKHGDPHYEDYQQYKKLTKDIEVLKNKQKQIEEESKIVQQSQTEAPLQSNRSAKSLSPRRYALKKAEEQLKKQNIISMTPQEEQIKNLNEEIKKMMEEKQQMKEQLSGFLEASKIQQELFTLSQNLYEQDQQLLEEITQLRQKLSHQASDEDLKNQISKLIQENLNLKENFSKVQLSQKKLLKIFNQQKSKIQQLSSKLTDQSMISQPEQPSQIQLDEQNISNSQVNKSLYSDMSIVIPNPINQSQIQEQQLEILLEKEKSKLKKTMETEYQLTIQKLEEQAKQGIQKRDEVIKKLKKEKLELNQELDSLKKQLQMITSSNEKMKSQIDEVKNESKLGEQLLQNQLRDLKSQNEKLYEKYEYETLQRKKLHNMIEDMKGKIRVFCRVRPMSINEKQMGSLEVVKVVDQLTLKIKLKKENTYLEDGKQSRLKGQQGNPDSHYIEKEFNFDSCFGPKSTQDDVFEDTKMLMQSALDGYNVCLFAYGQTGSGKTYTIQGTEENPGIVPRSLQELFQLKKRLEHNDHYTIKFECYMVELYLDQLIDLLNPTRQVQGASRTKLEIREDPQTGLVYIKNVSKITLNTKEEAEAIYERGLKSRKVSSTDMNDVSSRSHLIYSVIVQSINNETQQRFYGKISFVDLAGSERVSKSNPSIERLKEGQAINLSLKALGDVITNLCRGSQRSHIPYRDNKLTHLMKDSLGGNSKTLMFVNISPADYNSQESKMSLFFGMNVKSIQNDVQKNVESQEMQRLKDENDKLQKIIDQNLRTTITNNKSLKA